MFMVECIYVHVRVHDFPTYCKVQDAITDVLQRPVRSAAAIMILK